MSGESLGVTPDGYPHGPNQPEYAGHNWAFGDEATSPVEGPGLKQHTQPAGPYEATDAIADSVVGSAVEQQTGTVDPGALLDAYRRTEEGMRGPIS